MSDIIVEGYLEKESMHFKILRKRWIVLKSDKNLYSFKSRNEKTSKDVTEIIDLKTCNKVITPKNLFVKKKEFSLVFDKKERVFVAASEYERSKWMIYIAVYIKSIIHNNDNIDILLSQFNSTNESKNQFKQINRFEVENKCFIDRFLKTTTVNERWEFNAFEQFNTYQMICGKIPRFVVAKRDINDTGNDLLGSTYFDFYGSVPFDHKMKDTLKTILMSHISIDIVDVILLYLDDDNEEFLFSVEKKKYGHSGLSYTDLYIGDILSVSTNYSDERGGSSKSKIDEKADKALIMYIVWIVYVLSDGPSMLKCIGIRGLCDFFFSEHQIRNELKLIMEYDILSKKRPRKQRPSSYREWSWRQW
eukprot:406930_1